MGGVEWRVPEAVAGAVEESRAALRGALAEPLGAWRQDVASKRPGPVVFSSPGGAEGGSWRRFRAELLFSMPAQDGAEEGGGEEGCAENHLLRDIFENYCLFHRRETWDPSIATQRELRRWEGGYSCVAYTTGAAAGGAIGPRLMVDVRVHQSEKLPFENCSTNSADFDDEALHGLGEGGRKHVRAANLPGGGALWRGSGGGPPGGAGCSASACSAGPISGAGCRPPSRTAPRRGPTGTSWRAGFPSSRLQVGGWSTGGRRCRAGVRPPRPPRARSRPGVRHRMTARCAVGLSLVKLFSISLSMR